MDDIAAERADSDLAREVAPQTGAPWARLLERWVHAPAVAGYLLLTVVVLWPAIAQFRTRAMANDIDAAMFTWLWGAMPDAVADGRNPYRTDLIFHPVGADLAVTTTSPLIALVTWPIRESLGAQAQVNALQLVTFFLAGLATYFLAHRVCQHRGAAFVAGLGYAMLPARFVHMAGSLNLISTALIPFGLLLLLRFTEAPSTRRAVALGAVCGGAFLIDPQLTILLGMGLLALGWVHRHVLLAERRRLLGALGIALLVAAPLLVPMARAMAQGGVGEADPTRASLVYASSPLSWVVPPLEQQRVGSLLPEMERLTPTLEGVAYTGLVLLGLAVAGVSLSAGAARRGWVAMALVGFVLSLGPYPFVRNTMIEIPLPFFLLREIPGIEAMRVPGRFGLLGALGVYVLAAIALSDLARRMPRRAPLLLAAVGAVTLLELYPRDLPGRVEEVSEVYQAIAADPATGAVLEVPLKWSMTQDYFGYEGFDEDFRFLFTQQVHGRPTVSGAVSRFPDASLEELLSTPVYRQVLALGGDSRFDDDATFGEADLAALGIGFVAYNRADPAPRALRYLESLDLPVLADDGTVIVWKVGP